MVDNEVSAAFGLKAKRFLEEKMVGILEKLTTQIKAENASFPLVPSQQLLNTCPGRPGMKRRLVRCHAHPRVQWGRPRRQRGGVCVCVLLSNAASLDGT